VPFSSKTAIFGVLKAVFGRFCRFLAVFITSEMISEASPGVSEASKTVSEASPGVPEASGAVPKPSPAVPVTSPAAGEVSGSVPVVSKAPGEFPNVAQRALRTIKANRAV
jgi:hypothetical protein